MEDNDIKSPDDQPEAEAGPTTPEDDQIAVLENKPLLEEIKIPSEENKVLTEEGNIPAEESKPVPEENELKAEAIKLKAEEFRTKAVDTKPKTGDRSSKAEQRQRWIERAVKNLSAIESELDNLEYGHWDYFWRKYQEFWKHSARISRMFTTLRPLLKKDRDRLWIRYKNICRETKKTQRNEWTIRRSDSQIKMGVIELTLKDAREYIDQAKNSEDLKKARSLMQEALDRLRVNNLMREDRKQCWKLYREANIALQNRRQSLWDTGIQQIQAQLSESLQAATSGNPHMALAKIQEIQKTIFQAELTREQRETILKSCQEAWDKAIARVEERKRAKEERSKETIKRTETRLGYWHELIRKNEDAISKLENQIDNLEEQGARRKVPEHVDAHAYKIEEKYGKIRDMRELNRRLEERIQSLWNKVEGPEEQK